MSRKKYYPNNWKAIKDIPDDVFEPTDYEVIIENLVTGWELAGSVDTILRSTNLITKKVTEHTFIRPSNAKKKLEKLCNEGVNEIIVMRAEEMYHIFPQYIQDDDLPDDN